jgi:hypothetical protein
MTYDEVIEQLKTMNEVPLNDSDENFRRILPSMFAYADGRIYREIVFLQVLMTQAQPVTLTARNREVLLPTSVMALRSVNLITPAGSGNVITISGKRTPLERIQPDVLDYLWPQESFRRGPPQKYAVIGGFAPPIVPAPANPSQALQLRVRFMPTPDQNYPVEFMGDIRPLPLSNKNPETFLSVYYPEMFIAACMIFAAGYQRDFGAQAEDPQRASSWETQYSNLRMGVTLEAARMRGEGPGFTAVMPAPLAQPRAP